MDEGGQVCTEEDPMQVTSETELEPKSGHTRTSSYSVPAPEVWLGVVKGRNTGPAVLRP